MTASALAAAAMADLFVSWVSVASPISVIERATSSVLDAAPKPIGAGEDCPAPSSLSMSLLTNIS